jgi:hypothetical protein
MEVNGITRRPEGVRRGVVLLLCVVGTGLLGVQPARAAKIKKLVLTPSEAKVFVSWSHFLANGETTWSQRHAPAFTPAIRTTIWQILKTDTQAQSLANPMIDYLLWRRSLDPQRFQANHPNLSPTLAQLLKTPSLPPGVPPPTYKPVPQTSVSPKPSISPQTLSGPPPSPSPSDVPPAAVPEPSALLLAVTMTGVGLFWRHRRFKSLPN